VQIECRIVLAMLAATAAMLPAWAQKGVPVLGFLHAAAADPTSHNLAAFRNGLNDTGYAEGRNLVIEYRWAEGQFERLPGMAADLVSRHVAAIAALGGPAPALAAKAATSTVPIVFDTGLIDPVQAGLVASFNRPGGNITGVFLFTGELQAKSLQLLTEILPKDAVLAALVNRNSAGIKSEKNRIESASRTLGRPVLIIEVGTEADLDPAFADMGARRVGGLLASPDPLFTTHREQIVRLAAQHRIATIYAWGEFAALGGLMTYGNILDDGYRQAGAYAGRILHGENPADMPVIRPTRFKFTVNLKTAAALGLTIPPTIMLLADELIE